MIIMYEMLGIYYWNNTATLISTECTRDNKSQIESRWKIHVHVHVHV